MENPIDELRRRLRTELGVEGAMLEPKEKVRELIKLIVDDAPKEELSAKATEIRDYFLTLSEEHQASSVLFYQLLQRFGINQPALPDAPADEQ